MDNRILKIKMTNFHPESRSMTIFGKSQCQKVVKLYYIAITFEILDQNKKIVFLDGSCHQLFKNISFI